MIRTCGFWRLGAATVVVLTLGPAADAAPEPRRIRGNLFLLEEAYNQEPGVIQHIQSFIYDPNTRGWDYAFTEEWPVPTDRHQLSITVPAARATQASDVLLGDVLVNYRFQAIGAGGAGRLAFAPRVSLLLPTGDWREGAGSGATGLQVNLPVSFEMGPHFVTHLNGGATLTPHSEFWNGRKTTLDANAGVALVWQPLPRINPLIEVAYLSNEEGRLGYVRSGSGRHVVIRPLTWLRREPTLVINPGIRAAFNLKSGLQLVPGLSTPIEISRYSADERRQSVLLYLSFEHQAFTPRGTLASGSEEGLR